MFKYCIQLLNINKFELYCIQLLLIINMDKKFKKVCELNSNNNSKFVTACLGDISSNYILATDESKHTYLWKRGSLNPLTVKQM